MSLSTKTYANLYSCYCISVISSAEAVKSRDKSRPRTMPKKGAFWVCRQMERGVGRAHILCRWRRKWVKFTGKNNTKKKQPKKKTQKTKMKLKKQNKTNLCITHAFAFERLRIPWFFFFSSFFNHFHRGCFKQMSRLWNFKDNRFLRIPILISVTPP